jgi:hypothetical protein
MQSKPPESISRPSEEAKKAFNIIQNPSTVWYV